MKPKMGAGTVLHPLVGSEARTWRQGIYLRGRLGHTCGMGEGENTNPWPAPGGEGFWGSILLGTLRNWRVFQNPHNVGGGGSALCSPHPPCLDYPWGQYCSEFPSPPACSPASSCGAGELDQAGKAQTAVSPFLGSFTLSQFFLASL